VRRQEGEEEVLWLTRVVCNADADAV